MESKRILKLKYGGIAKKSDFPKDFEALEEKAKEFHPINESTQKFQFIDENTNMEIRHQEDFDLMSREYENEKIIKISINVVDKPNEINEPNFSVSNLSIKKNEDEIMSINNNLDDLKIEEPDDKMKREINQIVDNKIQNLKENIAEDIFKSIKIQLSKNEQMNAKEKNNIIHKGIKCNNCGMENIEGTRYKCINCPEFNLCEKCEENCEHIVNHIFLKIRRPIQDKILNNKIKNFSYKNGDYNYSIEDKIFNFPLNCKENDSITKQIIITNNGFEEWINGAIFKCLPESELKGEDYKIEQSIKINENINVDIIFNNIKKDLATFKDEYDVYYQMFNENEEAFGNITHFKVIFKD